VDLAQALPGLSERERQVVILTIGARINVAYEMYAHEELARRAGLDPAQIAALCAGTTPTGLSPREALAAQFTTGLTRGGVVPGPVYDTAVETLGQEGLDAIATGAPPPRPTASCATPPCCASNSVREITKRAIVVFSVT
jgi:4-carboxymuconolactone decarboxylase